MISSSRKRGNCRCCRGSNCCTNPASLSVGLNSSLDNTLVAIYCAACGFTYGSGQAPIPGADLSAVTSPLVLSGPSGSTVTVTFLGTAEIRVVGTSFSAMMCDGENVVYVHGGGLVTFAFVAPVGKRICEAYIPISDVTPGDTSFDLSATTDLPDTVSTTLTGTSTLYAPCPSLNSLLNPNVNVSAPSGDSITQATVVLPAGGGAFGYPVLCVVDL